ncbi:MAG: hypothetical protein FD174_1625 [Geobacteraceae bacterium]|nr:MAG: hypothetical protein FD174_1625 [Geobacteraceae bacterium]
MHHTFRAAITAVLVACTALPALASMAMSEPESGDFRLHATIELSNEDLNSAPTHSRTGRMPKKDAYILSGVAGSLFPEHAASDASEQTNHLSSVPAGANLSAFIKAAAPMGSYYSRDGINLQEIFSDRALAGWSGRNDLPAQSLAMLASLPPIVGSGAVPLGGSSIQIQGGSSQIAQVIPKSSTEAAGVPIPPAFFLMGSGLLGMLPFRKRIVKPVKGAA